MPGGVFGDLLANSILIDDPLRRYNDVAYRWVSEDDWIYTLNFNGNYHNIIIFLLMYNFIRLASVLVHPPCINTQVTSRGCVVQSS